MGYGPEILQAQLTDSETFHHIFTTVYQHTDTGPAMEIIVFVDESAGFGLWSRTLSI